MWGYKAAWAMPICWAWAAAARSALRISGRRSSNCAGMPTTTSRGAVGIGRCPKRACRSVGGMPNKVQSWSWVCRNWISNAGIVGLDLRERGLLLGNVQFA